MTPKIWIDVEKELPPDDWRGLVVTDVRPNRPVFAHTADKCYRNNFPCAEYFIGPWRDSILTGEHMKKKAKIIMWLKIAEEDELYPSIPDADKLTRHNWIIGGE